jgi:hypothetical protein
MPKSSQNGLIHLLLPIIFLLLLGAGAFFFFSLQDKTPKSTNSNIQSSPQPSVTTSQPLFLALDSPTASTSVVDDTILIKGRTLPNTTITLYNDTDDAMVQSDSSGNFEGKLLLGSGENNLTITAFGDNGEEKTYNLIMTYNPS